MRVLVCGDRNWSDTAYIYDILDRLIAIFEVSVIIEGAARGADSIAASWALSRKIELESYPAEWETFGRAAGPRRNQQMLNTKPELILAFHKDIEHSKGTKDMVERGRKAGVPTWVMPDEEAMIAALEDGVYV